MIRKRKRKEKKRKENRTQQRVHNNTPSLRGEPPDRPKCFDGVRSWNVEFEWWNGQLYFVTHWYTAIFLQLDVEIRNAFAAFVVGDMGRKKKSHGFVAWYMDKILRVITDEGSDMRLGVRFRIPMLWQHRGVFAVEWQFVRNQVERKEIIITVRNLVLGCRWNIEDVGM